MFNEKIVGLSIPDDDLDNWEELLKKEFDKEEVFQILYEKSEEFRNREKNKITKRLHESEKKIVEIKEGIKQRIVFYNTQERKNHKEGTENMSQEILTLREEKRLLAVEVEKLRVIIGIIDKTNDLG